MLEKTVDLQNFYDVLPCTLDLYIVSGAKKSVLVLPGGGYNGVSLREGAPVARRFNQSGYNTFVLTYSTLDNFAPDSMRFPSQLLQAAAAIDYIRSIAKQHRFSKKVAVCGFSAGGHLAASISTMYAKPYAARALGLTPKAVRPDASILCYPVISGVKNPHQGSICNITGGDTALIKEVSAERQVRANTPPAFLWHTSDDDAVNVTNSLEYARALRAKGIEFELHVFDKGPHGLSLCDSTTDIVDEHCAVWFDIMLRWLQRAM